MNKIIAILTVFLLFTPFIHAQDRKADLILKEVSAKTKANKTIKIDFTYTFEQKGQKKKETRTGSLLNKGDKYRLDISGQTVISDGKTVWTYIKDANEVQINSVGSEEESFTPTKLLNSYKDNYRAKFSREAIQDGKTIQIIELVPLKKGKKLVKVLLGIDKAQQQVYSFTVFNKDGSSYSYKIKRYLTGQSFSDSEFTFKSSSYPGVEVIDMR